MRNRTATTALLSLLVAGLAGCGGSDVSAAPDDAPRAEFCDSYASRLEAVARGAGEDGPDRAAEAMQDWASEVQDVGTPRDIPDDARRGFEILVEEVESLDPDATRRELEGLGDELGTRAQRDLEAFGEYAVSTCPEAVERLVGGMSDRLQGELGRLEDELGEQLGDLDLGDLEDQLGQLEDVTPGG